MRPERRDDTASLPGSSSFPARGVRWQRQLGRRENGAPRRIREPRSPPNGGGPDGTHAMVLPRTAGRIPGEDSQEHEPGSDGPAGEILLPEPPLLEDEPVAAGCPAPRLGKSAE